MDNNRLHRRLKGKYRVAHKIGEPRYSYHKCYGHSQKKENHKTQQKKCHVLSAKLFAFIEMLYAFYYFHDGRNRHRECRDDKAQRHQRVRNRYRLVRPEPLRPRKAHPENAYNGSHAENHHVQGNKHDLLHLFREEPRHYVDSDELPAPPRDVRAEERRPREEEHRQIHVPRHRYFQEAQYRRGEHEDYQEHEAGPAYRRLNPAAPFIYFFHNHFQNAKRLPSFRHGQKGAGKTPCKAVRNDSRPLFKLAEKPVLQPRGEPEVVVRVQRLDCLLEFGNIDVRNRDAVLPHVVVEPLLLASDYLAVLDGSIAHNLGEKLAVGGRHAVVERGRADERRLEHVVLRHREVLDDLVKARAVSRGDLNLATVKRLRLDSGENLAPRDSDVRETEIPREVVSDGISETADAEPRQVADMLHGRRRVEAAETVVHVRDVHDSLLLKLRLPFLEKRRVRKFLQDRRVGQDVGRHEDVQIRNLELAREPSGVARDDKAYAELRLRHQRVRIARKRARNLNGGVEPSRLVELVGDSLHHAALPRRRRLSPRERDGNLRVGSLLRA